MAVFVSRYASAFLDVATAAHLDTAAIDSQLADFLATWNGSADLRAFFANPAIPAVQKVSFLDKLNVKMGLQKELRNLLACSSTTIASAQSPKSQQPIASSSRISLVFVRQRSPPRASWTRQSANRSLPASASWPARALKQVSSWMSLSSAERWFVLAPRYTTAPFADGSTG